MARINLLPWREELRKEREKEFYTMLASAAVLALALWGGVHYYHTLLIDQQNARNAFLEEEITKLDKKIEEIQELEKEKERLLARMRAIEQLQGNRPLIVRLFDELVTSLPDGVSLTQVSQKDNKITIDGVAESNARVSSFMRNLESSDWLKDPELEIIQAKDEQGQRISNFKLQFSQVIPTSEEEEEDV
ncbi:MAG TPA: PilN domain-containing protein [Gammaproteobacteria bacterium]|nr:PilN domain-containing protein [Gammaproteobacteria bacterium]